MATFTMKMIAADSIIAKYPTDEEQETYWLLQKMLMSVMFCVTEERGKYEEEVLLLEEDLMIADLKRQDEMKCKCTCQKLNCAKYDDETFATTMGPRLKPLEEFTLPVQAISTHYSKQFRKGRRDDSQLTIKLHPFIQPMGIPRADIIKGRLVAKKLKCAKRTLP